MKLVSIATQSVLLFSMLVFEHHRNIGSDKDLSTILNPHQKTEKHWSYEGETGPEHWAELEKLYACDQTHQSPINIIAKDAILMSAVEAKALEIHYASDTKIISVENNGHTIQYNFEPNDYLTYNGVRFDLKQIHFHNSAEHTINGIRYPLEIHLVHMCNYGRLIVLAVMAEQGETSEPFNFLEKYLPLETGEKKPVNAPFDLNLNFPENRKYFNYQGSLTTPPCTENVNWFVFREPISVSAEQIKILHNLMPSDNYRHEQPLNDRVVKTNI